MESIISRFLSLFNGSRRSEILGVGRDKALGSSALETLIFNFWLILGVILILLAFFLGRVTKFMENQPAFSFESSPQEDQTYKREKAQLFGIVSTSTIVASSGGKKYYFVWCKGVGNIRENKKRYFNTEADAQRAGYTLANNCK